ncbi:chitin deacetylase [Thecaphora frezii]
MVRLSSATLCAALVAASAASAHINHVKRQASPTSTFTGTLAPSVSAIVATISSGEGNPTATQALYSTAIPGAANPQITNAPPLPDASQIPNSDFPTLDQVPPTNSPQVQKWIQGIDWSKVPNVTATVDSASCSGNPTQLAAAGADGNCWWTCGGCTRDTDITTCPTKNTWGLSYDDGPSPYTPQLLDYLNEHNLKSTFFVVGSRVLSRPAMLQLEYEAGHQISVHTWSHNALTTLTNEQIVAELGWTREVIRRVIGVTPNTMRPPYGDIDDRVRAISNQMGLTPIIWTTAPGGGNYDTNDWKIGAGTVSAAEVVVTFENIIKSAPQLDTGYIVLAHDLYQQSVELATEVVLPFALNMTPKQNLMPIVECLNKLPGDAYVETNRNVSGSHATATASGSAAARTAGGKASAPTTTGGSKATGGASGNTSGAPSDAAVSLKVLATLVASALLGAAALL